MGEYNIDKTMVCQKFFQVLPQGLQGSMINFEPIDQFTHFSDWVEAAVRQCHGSVRDACPQGRPRVARPSKVRTKNIGKAKCRESQRKHMDWLDGSGREYYRIGWTHQIVCRLEISVLITGLDMIG